jgi:hypothetical protein
LKDTKPGKNLFLAENGTLASLEMSWEVVRYMTTYGGRNMNGSKACVVWRMCKEVKHVSCKTQDGVSLHLSSGGTVMKNFPLKDVMDANISTVKFIRCSGFVHRRFHL